MPFACFSFALLSITTGLSAILNATVPMFGALVAWFWLKDRPDGSRVLGLVIGFAGVAMLAWDKAGFKPDASGMAPGWAVLACLLAALCYAVSASATKLPGRLAGAGDGHRQPDRRHPGPRVARHLALAGAHAEPAGVAGAGGRGRACTGIAYILYFRLIEHAGPARALTVTFLVPVFAVFYGAVFLGEAITGWMLICGGVIVCGIALSTGWLELRPAQGAMNRPARSSCASRHRNRAIRWWRRQPGARRARIARGGGPAASRADGVEKAAEDCLKFAIEARQVAQAAARRFVFQGQCFGALGQHVDLHLGPGSARRRRRGTG